MTANTRTPENRLAEARKQIHIVADRIDDPEFIADLQNADMLIATVEEELKPDA